MFSGTDGEITLVVKQPRIEDYDRIVEAKQNFSPESLRRYHSPLLRHIGRDLCEHPIFTAANEGKLYLISLIGDEIAILSQQNYSGKGEDRKADCALVIADKWQKTGVGPLHSEIIKPILKSLGAHRATGRIMTDKRMLEIFNRWGWSVDETKIDPRQRFTYIYRDVS